MDDFDFVADFAVVLLLLFVLLAVWVFYVVELFVEAVEFVAHLL